MFTKKMDAVRDLFLKWYLDGGDNELAMDVIHSMLDTSNAVRQNILDNILE